MTTKDILTSDELIAKIASLTCDAINYCQANGLSKINIVKYIKEHLNDDQTKN
ncbi:MAG: hypothetical protein Q4C49_01040 [Bacillota bacterium]|nr:hypothetical protein [Bacillota bacterium]